MRKMEGLKKEVQEPEFIGPEDFDILLVGWGSTWGPIAEAVRLLNGVGEKAAALVFGDVYPLPEREIVQKSAKAKRVINVEQNATGQLAGLIREFTGVTMDGSVLKYDGRQISGEEIAAQVKGGAI
jgi:2-oxoglutarate ferredoxin oxidoreductase subunit alpha